MYSKSIYCKLCILYVPQNSALDFVLMFLFLLLIRVNGVPESFIPEQLNIKKIFSGASDTACFSFPISR